jgi:CheY-like chemotaxis protein
VPKRVLDVGQCGPDHASLSRFLTSHFDVDVDRAHHLDDTLSKLRDQSYDLVMINRKLDIDHSEGMDILKTIKSDPKLKHTPVVLISNYADAQEAAIAAGAEPGFGKAELRSSKSKERVTAILG